MRELLLLLSKYPYDEKDKPALERAIRSVSDWKQAVDLVNKHGIIALAAYNINEAGLCNLVPYEAMTLINHGRTHSLVRNVWLTQRWKEVNSILTGAGIKHVLLKGMALEHTVYSGGGLRQMSDTDILVKKEESLRAWKILKENGFKSQIIKSSWHKNILSEIGTHLPPLIKDNYMVEVHHTLIKDKKSCLQESLAIENSKEIVIDGLKAYILSKEINLLFLKEHLMKHLMAGEYQLKLSTDIWLLNHEEFPEITTKLVYNPDQFRINNIKESYKAQIASLSKKNRWKYILGCILPSHAWMKERYKCNSLVAIFMYPVRMGKLLWQMT